MKRQRALILLASIIPITIAANFIRVITLVLIAYYGGPDMLEGTVHDLTGIGLFIVAVVLLFLLEFTPGLWHRDGKAAAQNAPGGNI